MKTLSSIILVNSMFDIGWLQMKNMIYISLFKCAWYVLFKILVLYGQWEINYIIFLDA